MADSTQINIVIYKPIVLFLPNIIFVFLKVWYKVTKIDIINRIISGQKKDNICSRDESDIGKKLQYRINPTLRRSHIINNQQLTQQNSVTTTCG